MFPADKSVDRMRPFPAEALGRRRRQALGKVEGLPAGLRVHDLRHTGNTLAAAPAPAPRELMAAWWRTPGLTSASQE